MNRADAFLRDHLEPMYGDVGESAPFIKRLSSWMADADAAVLLYLVLRELRTLNARLAAQAPAAAGKKRR